MSLIDCEECGKQISDKAITCPNCGSPVVGNQPLTRSQIYPYLEYAEVPWYRRSSVNSFFILINILTAGRVPLILWTCINLLSGDIYYKSKDKQGHLKKWSVGNKVVAVLILATNIWVIFYSLST